MEVWREDDIWIYTAEGDSKKNSRPLLFAAAADYAAHIPGENGYKPEEKTGNSPGPTAGKEGEWRVETGPHGKPFFPARPDIRFCITHSGPFWLCAFSGHEVGLDLQCHEKKTGFWHTRRIADRFFHPAENAFLRAGGCFFDVWAAKESFVKFMGTGIGDDFGDFSVAGPEGLLERPAVPAGYPAPRLLFLPFKEDFSLCLCAEHIGRVCEAFRQQDGKEGFVYRFQKQALK